MKICHFVQKAQVIVAIYNAEYYCIVTKNSKALDLGQTALQIFTVILSHYSSLIRARDETKIVLAEAGSPNDNILKASP